MSELSRRSVLKAGQAAQAVAGGYTPDLAGITMDQLPRVMGSHIAENLFVDLSGTVRPFGDQTAQARSLLRRQDPLRTGLGQLPQRHRRDMTSMYPPHREHRPRSH